MSMVDNSERRFHWTRERTIKFINLVKKHPVIWDSNSKHYRNKFQRELVYDAISYQMQITNELVKKKIHILRSQYLSEVKKMRNRNFNKPIWPYFNALKFLFQNKNSNNSEIDDNSSTEIESFCNEDNFEVENEIYSPEKRQRLDINEDEEVEQQNINEEDQSCYKWTKSEILNLIRLYRQNPILYNMNTPDYYNKNKRQKALNEIAQQFNTTVEIVKSKIHTLRSYYIAELKKMKKRNSKEPMWAFFDEVKFLYAKEFYTPRGSFTKTSGDLDSNEDTIECLTNHDESEVALSVNSEVPESLCDSQVPTCITCEERDEFTIFGETVASELRLTKDYKQIHNILKRQILKAVKEAKESISDFTQ